MKLYKYELPGKMNVSGSLFAKNSSEAREKVLEMHRETENLRLPIGTKIWEEMLSGNTKNSINEIIKKSMILAKKGKGKGKNTKKNGKKTKKSDKKTKKSDKTTKKSDKTTKKTDVSPSA